MTGFRWAAWLPHDPLRPRTLLEACAELRALSGVSALFDSSGVWLRGESLDAHADRQLRSVPNLRRYHVRHRRALVPWGERLRSAELPEGEWLPLTEALQLEFPATKLLARDDFSVRVELRWRRENVAAAAANMLRAPLSAICQFAEECSASRLAGMRFVASRKGEVWLWGETLLPIAGEYAREQQGLALPLGMTWDPPIPAQVLSKRLEVQPGEVLIFDDPHDYVRIGSWVTLTRSALRRTAAAIYGDGGDHG